MKKQEIVLVKKLRLFEILLRAGICAMFLAHGMLALTGNENWVPLITSFGIGDHAAKLLLPAIGLMDVVVAWTIIVNPSRALILWTVAWPFLTALSRPISGQPIWEFIERTPNWVLPLVWLWMKGFPRSWKELWKHEPLEENYTTDLQVA
ncbi:MAG TPA: hypothetical protein VI112_15565 [Bacteroidia bacterium]|jgi:hypothetical protein